MISIVIPCRDLGRWLDEALESVFAQTRQDFEIVIVDDGSRDEATVRCFDAWQRERTRLLRTPPEGVCAARNRGATEARGELLCFLDADDRLRPRFLERLAGRLEAEPALTFASPWIHLFGDEEWDWTPDRCDLPALLSECTVATPALVRKRAFLDAGGFDPAFSAGHEDWDLWLTIVEGGGAGAIVPEILFDYRRRAGSRSDAADWGEGWDRLHRALVAKHRASYRRHLFAVVAERERHLCSVLGGLDDVTRQVEALRARVGR